MARKISLERALTADSEPLRAPPDWTNAELGTVNGAVVLHAGAGRLEGAWHRQDSDECLLVVRGELLLEDDGGTYRIGPGECVLVRAGERHRTAVPVDCLLLSIEAVGMRRLEP